MEKDVQGFLKELVTLTEKYSISIGGCGCCGSPVLADATVDDFKVIKINLKYNKQTKQYSVEEHEGAMYEKDGIIYNPDGTKYVEENL